MELIKTMHSKICNAIANKSIYEAVETLSEAIDAHFLEEYKPEFYNYIETYNNLGTYTGLGVQDPLRDEIYQQVQRDLLSLSDKVRNHVLTKHIDDKFAREKRDFLLSPIAHTQSISGQIQEICDTGTKLENLKRKDALNNLFNHLIFSDNFSEDDVSVLKKYSLNKKLYPVEKSLIVSAITINLLYSFGEEKFHILLDYYDTNEQFSSNRALVGLALAFYKYDNRMSLYKKIINRIEALSDDSSTTSFLREIIFQFIRTKDTGKISEKLQNEIIPEMMKIQPKIAEKLDLNNLISDSLIEDKNPDWEEVFEDAPNLLSKMEEMSKLQLEGSDVFMSAFSQLKHFPFFYKPANWLLPFYKENTDALSAFTYDEENINSDTFLKGLENSAFICNSDKYSFCLNVKMMPASQKKMIIEMFKWELDQMNEISKEDKILNKTIINKNILITYIQDLYRFFKLHDWKNSFNDIFDNKLNIENTFFYKKVVSNDKLLLEIADYYFEKNYWEEAAETYKKVELQGNISKNLFEKTGFSYQKLKNYPKALKYYQKAELYSDESVWLTKKIAYCLRQINEFEKALEYYFKAEAEQPENIYIHANIGHCYLSLEKYEEALKYYYKVEYYNPENNIVIRPIAWCSFVLGKFDDAEKYYKKLVTRKPSTFDYINFGHVLLCKKLVQFAIHPYIKALEIIGIEKFRAIMSDDYHFLAKHGIEQIEFALITDHVRFVISTK